MKRCLTTTLVILSTLTSIPAAASPTRTAAPSKISWHGCARGADDDVGSALDQAGAQCGDLTVPLDYRRPQGRTITVAMSRLPARNRAERRGVLMVNTGGPGGSALGDVLVIRDWTGDVGARFDLIGLDPRFVGRSTALDCDWPVSTWIRGSGPDRAAFDRVAAFEADLARRCDAGPVEVLPFATTRNTARDMDRVRQALGESQISYLGYSYGTYLGSVYSQMFPGRTARMVLDSAVDPTSYGPRLLRPAGPANEAGLRDWAGWAARRNRQLHLGDSTAAVLATVDRIRARAALRPLRVGPFQLDQGVVTALLLDGLGDDRDEPSADLASRVQVLERAARGLPAPPTPSLAEALTFFLTGSESSYGSVQAAVLCGDVAAPRDPQVYWRDIRRAAVSEPRFATVTRNLGPCAFWPTRPRERPTVVHNSAPALIVQSTGDTRTSYAGAQALHRALTGSRMLTLANARIHAVFGNYANACVDDRVRRYLDDGVLPATDLTCAGGGQPR